MVKFVHVQRHLQSFRGDGIISVLRYFLMLYTVATNKHTHVPVIIITVVNKLREITNAFNYYCVHSVAERSKDLRLT